MNINVDDPGVRDSLIERLKCSSRQKRYKLHGHYKKFATLEEAKRNKPSFCPNKNNWDVLCDYFETPEFKVNEIWSVCLFSHDGSVSPFLFSLCENSS